VSAVRQRTGGGEIGRGSGPGRPVPRFVRRAGQRARREIYRPADLQYSQLPPRAMVRMAYNAMLGREPDEPAWTEQTLGLERGILVPTDIVDRIRCSVEFATVARIGASSLHSSLHASRMEFIVGLPPAKRIIDLGGGHTTDQRGALVALGYPYNFEELVIVDLPPDDRHPLYHSERYEGIHTETGKVRYEYRSMADLSFAADASVDLVYSGQSIEHVTEADGDTVLRESFRVLRPGGFMAIDTPNASVCRLQQEGFIDPDHKVEYTLAELRHKVACSGFEVRFQRGLNWGGPAVAEGRFDPAALAGNQGVYFDAEGCYLLAVIVQRPS